MNKLTVEQIRSMVKKLKEKSLKTYNNCYWLISFHWFNWFGKN